MDDDFANEVLSLYENNRWRDILNLKVNILDDKVHSLLWVWPSLENLLFMKAIVNYFNLKGVSSIGCGSGMFEWLLQKSSDIEVTGIEIDESWWSSKYVKYKFIPLKFIKMPPNEDLLTSNHALMFCYFNFGDAFREYIKNYHGSVVFIIGPGPGRGTLTDPQPFSADFGNKEWQLYANQEVKDTKDFIAVYVRINNISSSVIDR